MVLYPERRGLWRRGVRLGSPAVVVLAAVLALTAALVSCRAPAPAPQPEGSGPGRGAVTDGAVTDGAGAELVSGLAAPWSMVLLADTTVLISQRDNGQVLETTTPGTTRIVGTLPGVDPGGEGGLLGLALGPGCPSSASADPGCIDLFAYLTSPEDNRIVRLPVTGAPGSRTLGTPKLILAGIPKAGNHNGGRIAFGPDGMLYATTGDAGKRDSAQDTTSLAGKILRLAPDGGIPASNPFPGSPVWSLGHRNPQGIAWDSMGRMWASEFGQNTWDELNEIVPGANYGWPFVEGVGSDSRFHNPVLTWSTAAASPSGIAIDGTTLYMAALRGERLWVVNLDDEPTAQARFAGAFGRLRDVALTPDGRLYVLTNNTDGRGEPGSGDDRVISLSP